MSENEHRSEGPSETDWESRSVSPLESARIVDICDACQRIRTKWCDPDFVCKSHLGIRYTDCLARFYQTSAKRLD